MSKIDFHFRLFGVFVLLALAAAGCNLNQSSGTVKGIVYGDLNGNGKIDTGEGPLAGVTMSIDGCGPGQTQTTAASGGFKFTGLTPGSCTVSASKPDWAFTGSAPGGGYPIPAASTPGVTTDLSITLAPAAALIPTATPTPAFTATPSLTPTDTATPTVSTPMVESVSKTANCRFGPGLDYLPVGSLPPGIWVPINATIGDQSWWRIELPSSPGTFCWIGSSLAQTSGDLNQVKVVPTPGGIVIAISVSMSSALIHGSCSGGNTNNFTGTLTTNGPGPVSYTWRIDNSAGDNLGHTNALSAVFHTAGTQSVHAWSYTGGCDNYKVRLIVLDPNRKEADATYRVEP
jgi:hypothetical protein